MELVHSGKVRDVYADGDDLIIVASDRVSVYDVVLPTLIPDKGKILTQLSTWWFERLSDTTPHHIISTSEVPAEWEGRAVRCRRLTMIPVEWIARGYLAGLGLKEYEKNGTVSGISLPPGLVEGSKLPEPIFTPTTKATEGHDEFITYDDVVSEIGAETAAHLRSVTLEVYRRGAAVAADRGIIIADTKLEFGLSPSGEPILADEVLTPDSSRFWPAADWHPGRPQHSLDKQFVRDWSSTLDWDRTPPGPPIPPEIVTATQARYMEVYERLTATPWPPEHRDPTSQSEPRSLERRLREHADLGFESQAGGIEAFHAASRWAAARPIPVPPPVTMTALPWWLPEAVSAMSGLVLPVLSPAAMRSLWVSVAVLVRR